MATIKNPVEWIGAQLNSAAHAVGSTVRSLDHVQETVHSPAPAVRRIAVGDLREVLSKGWDDFGAYRSDVVFLAAIYAVVGLLLSRLAVGLDLLPLVFPLASGFAIIGPIAAVGLYELSRRREQGLPAKWINALDVFRAPAIGGVMVVGLLLVGIFLLWLLAAWFIFENTLGPDEPKSVAGFIRDVFLTDAGRTMIVVGVGVGFLFALLAMTISIVSLPLLLDRDVGLDTAIKKNLGPCGILESRSHGGVGIDRDGGPGDRIASLVPRPHCRAAGSGPRDLASLPQACGVTAFDSWRGA
jgi:uncharacterized membrane protein